MRSAFDGKPHQKSRGRVEASRLHPTSHVCVMDSFAGLALPRSIKQVLVGQLRYIVRFHSRHVVLFVPEVA